MVGVGILALLSQILNSTMIWALVVGYGTTVTAYGIYLIENNSGISNTYKYLAVIIATVIAYGLTQAAQNWFSLNTKVIDPVIIAGLVVTVANFGLNELQQYQQFLTDAVINDATIILGAIIVAASAVQNAPHGAVVSVSTLLTVIVPVLIVYIFQKIPWPSGIIPPAVAAKPTA